MIWSLTVLPCPSLVTHTWAINTNCIWAFQGTVIDAAINDTRMSFVSHILFLKNAIYHGCHILQPLCSHDKYKKLFPWSFSHGLYLFASISNCLFWPLLNFIYICYLLLFWSNQIYKLLSVLSPPVWILHSGILTLFDNAIISVLSLLVINILCCSLWWQSSIVFKQSVFYFACQYCITRMPQITVSLTFMVFSPHEKISGDRTHHHLTPHFISLYSLMSRFTPCWCSVHAPYATWKHSWNIQIYLQVRNVKSW